uniref:Uncharacterized protein n=1 Tax=Thermocrispum agreste TaxID=37925 RepID=A0A2W4JS41_9PSEU|nr:MAG: hypothetical protein DIU77_01355 [Thermocrispum agreste]
MLGQQLGKRTHGTPLNRRTTTRVRLSRPKTTRSTWMSKRARKRRGRKKKNANHGKKPNA